MKVYFYLCFFVLFCRFCSAGIIAHFSTSEGNFDVLLDFETAPMAVTNFIQLAGKGDDIFRTAVGVPFLTSSAHSLQAYRTTTDSDSQKLPLNVVYVPATDTMRAHILVRQVTTVIGVLEAFQPQGFFPDITGEDRVRLSILSNNPPQYQITLRYPRPWVDARFPLLREAPMYNRGLIIREIEPGRRFFAGTMTGDPLETPGYQIQDEVMRNAGNVANPFGNPFGSPWVLAMDSQGENQNGSRFFITTVADVSMNGRYTAIGTVLQNAGRQVVLNIVNAQVDAQGVPDRTMFISNIDIEHQGTDDVVFFETFHQLFMPGGVTPISLGMDRIDGVPSVVAPLLPQSQTSVYGSPNLLNFSQGFFGFQSPNATEPLQFDLTEQTRTIRRYFVRGFSTAQPFWYSDIDLDGTQFSFGATSGNSSGTLNMTLSQNVNDPDDPGEETFSVEYDMNMRIERINDEGASELVLSVGSGSCTARYSSEAGPFTGVLSFSNVFGPLNTDELTLHFDASRFSNSPVVELSSLVRRFDSRTTDPAIDFLSYSGVFRQIR